MGFQPINTRQITNASALSNIGSPANDSLDDILARINTAIASATSNQPYVAKSVSLTSGTTSLTVSLPAQPDTSYIVLAMMGNTTDAYPQYQEVEVTNKTVDGFTFTWNHPIDSGNYFLNYIIPFKVFPEVEASLSSGSKTLSSNLLMPQPFSGYAVISKIQNTSDAHPQFQPLVIGSNTTSQVNLSVNVPTDSANYQASYMIAATGQAAIANFATSVTVSLPVNYDTSSYAVIASIQNTVDSNPQYQPMIITGQNNQFVTFGWNTPRDTANYVINYYAISLTT